MNIMRIGTVSLIVGLILLLNASSEHVPLNVIFGRGEVSVNETGGYVMFMAPVGVGNLTVGFLRYPGSFHPAPPGFEDSVVLPVHMKVDDPTNRTIVEQDIVTPYSFEVDFKARGFYKVYLTNKGTETTTIPVGLRFEPNNPQNREADKYLLSILLAALGAILVSAGVVINFVSKHRQQHKP